ncbi:preprotein translocase subunit SecG [Xenorhabdus budapestensis]|uniref:Protein-export membrane protein SecG n=1 Tax=Xenorhabdus budapestensis TaxID=290110 RepID=A0A2D0J5L4_XENBU|nr:preprotein translocase subunit SecG [Xenorhabdus budapestensis]PHM29648.1 preprotein translocase subunit SecG [Xenorhabdus budapestensis]QTL39599.1 preprotein translocase subunit SecG [Xenorhabdus budapestensis]
MYGALLSIFLLVGIGLIALVLLQQGKGADMGASFGAGASATIFGSSGSANFMTRMTAVFATLFFVISLVLGNMTSNKTGSSGKWDDIAEPAHVEKQAEVPVVPAKPTKPNSDIPQ